MFCAKKVTKLPDLTVALSRPQPGCHQPNSPSQGITKLFPAGESLVSDIPAGDGKIPNLFYSF